MQTTSTDEEKKKRIRKPIKLWNLFESIGIFSKKRIGVSSKMSKKKIDTSDGAALIE